MELKFDLFTDIALKEINKIVDNLGDDLAWDKLFQDIGDFMREYENGNSDFSFVFSKDNMRDISERVNRDDGTRLYYEIEGSIERILKGYD